MSRLSDLVAPELPPQRQVGQHEARHAHEHDDEHQVNLWRQSEEVTGHPAHIPHPGGDQQ